MYHLREARIRQQRPTEGAGPFRPRRPFAPRRQSRLQCPVPFDSERGSPRPLARGLSSGVSCEYMLASSCVNLGRLQRLTEHRRDHQLVGKGRRDDATKLHIHKPREPRQALVCGAGCSDHTLAFERHSHEASLSCGEVWLRQEVGVCSMRFVPKRNGEMEEQRRDWDSRDQHFQRKCKTTYPWKRSR